MEEGFHHGPRGVRRSGAKHLRRNVQWVSEKFDQKELEADKATEKAEGTQVREAVTDDISLSRQSRTF